MKSILTLLLTVVIATVLNAQTTETPQQQAPATPAQAEPQQKKTAYEIIPAKRVVTPTPAASDNAKPVDISDIQKQQEQDQKVKESIEKREAYMQGQQTPAAAPQKKEEGTGQPK